jgi:protein ImuA
MDAVNLPNDSLSNEPDESGARRDALESLKKALRRAEQVPCDATWSEWKMSPVVTGTALDCLLPVGGLPRGSLVEWLVYGPGSGASLLALHVARAAGCSGARIVVIDSQLRFYAPAAAGLGIDPADLIVVRPRREADAMWALDQAIRCAGVAAVLWCGHKLDSHHFRRLQLASESSGSLGLLIRPHTVLREPSWAVLRLLVEPSVSGSSVSCSSSWRLRVRRLRGRTAAPRTFVELTIDDESGEIREAISEHSAAGQTSSRRRPA